jgi:hypothetical protein
MHKTTKWVSVAFIAIGLLSYSFISKPSSDGLKKGEKAPLASQEMRNIDNTILTLEKLKKDNGLLVVFSCNTCPFVVGSSDFPGWEKQYNDLNTLASDAKIGMVLINSNEAKRDDEDSFEAMRIQAKKQQYSMPYLVDNNSILADAFGAKTTPHVYLFDSNLKLVYQGSIDNSWDPKRDSEVTYLKDAIALVKDNKKIKTDATTPRGCSIKRVK